MTALSPPAVFKVPATPARIYLAAYWHDCVHTNLVRILREAGHEVFDFKSPPHGRGRFDWKDVDPNWMMWTARQYQEALKSPVTRAAYSARLEGMRWADTCVMLLRCGPTGHLEAGWMAAAGKRVILLTAEGQHPELMDCLAEEICVYDELLRFAREAAVMTAPRFAQRFDGREAWSKLTPEQQTEIGGLVLELGLCLYAIDSCEDPDDDGRPFDTAEVIILDALESTVGKAIPEVMAMEVLPVPSLLGQVCRACGCTEDDACDGGCAWVEADLCTSCAPERRQ